MAPNSKAGPSRPNATREAAAYAPKYKTKVIQSTSELLRHKKGKAKETIGAAFDVAQSRYLPETELIADVKNLPGAIRV